MALFAETSKSILLATGRAMETRCAEQKAVGESQSVNRKVRPLEVKAFRLLVNRSATWADWDEELLKIELLSIRRRESPALP
jgi:hypothetical protein